MAFHFSLAAVLRVRENVLMLEERALQSLQQKKALLEGQIESLETQIAEKESIRDQALRRFLPAGHLQAMIWDQQEAISRKKDLIELHQELGQKCEKQMKLYWAAYRDHETILNIWRGQHDAYQQKQERRQQKNMDDIFIARLRRD